jgi:Plasmid replication region DNA-binding N-term
MPTPSPESPSPFHTRQESLQLRVNQAAQALHNQGIRPTVTRIRSALGGGSPNDLTPALKHWRDSVLPTLTLSGEPTKLPPPPALPLQVADLAHELWQRALAAAVLEMKGGPGARETAFRTAEAQALREQLTSVRDQLQRESLAYGELRAQAARHEAIARDALARVSESATRERKLLRESGTLRQRVTELEASADKSARAPRNPPVRTQATKARKSPSLKPAAVARTRPKRKPGTRMRQRAAPRRRTSRHTKRPGA